MTTKTYQITSVRLSSLGEVGETVELSQEEYTDTPFNIYLVEVDEDSGLEGMSTTKDSPEKDTETVEDEGDKE